MDSDGECFAMMFTTTCWCGVLKFVKNWDVRDWSKRRCKECGSHLRVYRDDGALEHDYNDAEERARTCPRFSRDGFEQCLVVKQDVFMGVQPASKEVVAKVEELDDMNSSVSPTEYVWGELGDAVFAEGFTL